MHKKWIGWMEHEWKSLATPSCVLQTHVRVDMRRKWKEKSSRILKVIGTAYPVWNSLQYDSLEALLSPKRNMQHFNQPSYLQPSVRGRIFIIHQLILVQYEIPHRWHVWSPGAVLVQVVMICFRPESLLGCSCLSVRPFGPFVHEKPM